MIYTVEQLIDDFRSDVFDRPDIDDAGEERDTIWSADDILRYLNSACARLASDTLALRRRFEFPVAAGASTIRFPYDEVIEVLSMAFAIPGLGRRRVLREFDLDTGVCADDYGLQVYELPDLDAVGMPGYYTRDYDNTFLRLWKVPMYAGVLHAQAIVLPQPLYPGMPLPFTSVQDRDLLLMWMKKMAYAKQDADTLDMQRSESFEKEYQRHVLDRKSEIDRIRRNGGFVRPA